jgi:hypothetical protein
MLRNTNKVITLSHYFFREFLSLIEPVYEMDLEDDVSMDEVPSRNPGVMKGGHVAMTVSLAVAKSGRKGAAGQDSEVDGNLFVFLLPHESKTLFLVCLDTRSFLGIGEKRSSINDITALGGEGVNDYVTTVLKP